jgi:ribosome biogenesis GTPase
MRIAISPRLRARSFFIQDLIASILSEVPAEDYEEDEPVRGPWKKRTATERAAVETRKAQISFIGPRGCQGLVDGEPVYVKPQSSIAIGDWVEIDGAGTIRNVLPRATTLSRPDPLNYRNERVIAANVDVVVIVAAMRAPDLRPGLIDRYLIAIEKGRADVVLCLTKIDRVESEAEFRVLDPYRALGIPIYPVSNKTGAGVEELLTALAGRLAVLVGHSGVGKSSLMNAFAPDTNAATGEISKLYQKGRHTTTSSTMYRLARGIRIIDTPGVREFGLWDITVAQVERTFHDFDAYRGECQFGDCSHTHEPICGVRVALAEGKIPEQRYAAYLRIRDDVEHEH